MKTPLKPPFSTASTKPIQDHERNERSSKTPSQRAVWMQENDSVTLAPKGDKEEVPRLLLQRQARGQEVSVRQLPALDFQDGT